MSDRELGSEMRKIDRQLESVSDEAMLPVEERAKSPAAQGAGRGRAEEHLHVRRLRAAARSPSRSAWRMVFWPYAARCGLGLVGYLGAVARAR